VSSNDNLDQKNDILVEGAVSECDDRRLEGLQMIRNLLRRSAIRSLVH
jgi:hypothetical protein